MQLVNENVSILNPDEGQSYPLSGGCGRRFSACSPSCVVDGMALRGDAIDNIPGAPGIGDKGSVELIQTFGNCLKLLSIAPMK